MREIRTIKQKLDYLTHITKKIEVVIRLGINTDQLDRFFALMMDMIEEILSKSKIHRWVYTDRLRKLSEDTFDSITEYRAKIANLQKDEMLECLMAAITPKRISYKQCEDYCEDCEKLSMFRGFFDPVRGCGREQWD